MAELYEIFREVTGRRILRFPVPASVAKGMFKFIPGARRTTGITPESIDYFTHPTEYTCDNTLRDLAGTGIVCPPFAEYAAVLVRFMREHPEIGTEAMH